MPKQATPPASRLSESEFAFHHTAAE